MPDQRTLTLTPAEEALDDEPPPGIHKADTAPIGGVLNADQEAEVEANAAAAAGLLRGETQPLVNPRGSLVFSQEALEEDMKLLATLARHAESIDGSSPRQSIELRSNPRMSLELSSNPRGSLKAAGGLTWEALAAAAGEGESTEGTNSSVATVQQQKPEPPTKSATLPQLPTVGIDPPIEQPTMGHSPTAAHLPSRREGGAGGVSLSPVAQRPPSADQVSAAATHGSATHPSTSQVMPTCPSPRHGQSGGYHQHDPYQTPPPGSHFSTTPVYSGGPDFTNSSCNASTSVPRVSFTGASLGARPGGDGSGASGGGTFSNPCGTIASATCGSDMPPMLGSGEDTASQGNTVVEEGEAENPFQPVEDDEEGERSRERLLTFRESVASQQGVAGEDVPTETSDSMPPLGGSMAPGQPPRSGPPSPAVPGHSFPRTPDQTRPQHPPASAFAAATPGEPVEIVLQRQPWEKLGLSWVASGGLILQGCKEKTPAAECGAGACIGLQLTHVDGQPVHTARELTTRTTNKSQFTLRFAPPGQSVDGDGGKNRRKKAEKGPAARDGAGSVPLHMHGGGMHGGVEGPVAAVVTVQFKCGRRGLYGTPMHVAQAQAMVGQYVLVDASKGMVDMGLVVAAAPLPLGDPTARLPQLQVERLAQPTEVAQWFALGPEDEAATVFFREKAPEHGVDIQVFTADFQFDRKKLTVHYMSEIKKPDFRQLLAIGFKEFRCRIWMNNCRPAPGQPGEPLDWLQPRWPLPATVAPPLVSSEDAAVAVFPPFNPGPHPSSAHPSSIPRS
eukprot:Hpha_TRINITY_DN8428_c0_g2::TRINITY_DN8428_c0_g2_i1::g.34570::m.34570